MARTTFLLWFVLTLNSELSLLQPPEYCDYRCVPPCLIPVAFTESVLGRPDLTLVYVQGVDGCVWYVVAATASAVSLQTQWLFYSIPCLLTVRDCLFVLASLAPRTVSVSCVNVLLSGS